MKDTALRNEIRRWLTSLINDPIAKTLAKNSNLTKTQAETFVIDVLAERIADKDMIYEEKAKLRLIKTGVSRGSFNRTLAQARKNITRSIYTIILLGYLGIFESPNLDPYVEIANKISSYSQAYKEIWKSGKTSNEHIRIINMLQKEIENGLDELSHPRAMNKKA